MKCLACFHWATAEMIRTKTVTINGTDYNVYRCNGCGNVVLIPASMEP